MIAEIRWSERARRDLGQAFEYYRSIDPNLALQIIDRIEAKTEWLAVFPLTGTPVDQRLRKALVGQTPYLIFYLSGQRRLQIVRIRHSAENWRA